MLNLPNAITLTRIALVVVFTAAVSIADQYSWGYLAALVTFILAACTDWLDHGVIIPAGTSGKWKTAFQLAFCIASLLALTWTHTPEYLPSFLDQLAALCLWHGSGASNFLYQFTLWGSIILTVYSGAVYCVGARKFFNR